jgi:hypothetical protein
MIPRLSGFTSASYSRNLRGDGYGDGAPIYGSDGDGRMDPLRFDGRSPTKALASPFMPGHRLDSVLFVSFATDPLQQAIANTLVRMEP